MDFQTHKQSAKTDGGNTSDQFPMPKTEVDAEFWPLSGKPYFYVILQKTQVAKPFRMFIPREMSDRLPTTVVPAKIEHRGKVWDLLCLGDHVRKRFNSESWGKFVTDNQLKFEDACVFELTEGSTQSQVVEFKVQILRNGFPYELLQKAQGHSNHNPIEIE